MHRSTASRQLSRMAALALASTSGLLALAAPAAVAKKADTVLAPAIVGGTVCQGQAFSQAFLAYGDSRYYTLAPGGEFNGPSEGWTLSGGASVAAAVRPDGSTGDVLNLPAGSRAVSAPMCVTLAYPSSRLWISGAEGKRGVIASVSYAGTLSAITPQETGRITGKKEWTLSEFAVEPGLAGKEEAPREVRFVFESVKATQQLYGIYVDPRMR
jgi:hypothetical protein